MYRAAFDCGAEHLYAITLSAELSGSYNSAVLGMNLFLENHPDAKVHVFNSCSASVGETLIAKKIAEYEEAGLDFEAIIEKVDEFILHMHTYFVLESLDNLRKNGRLSAVKALVATALNIKPVMGATDQGVITQLGQARGMQKALRLMAETIAAELEHPEEKVLGLVHCNNPEACGICETGINEACKGKGHYCAGEFRSQHTLCGTGRNYYCGLGKM